VSSPFDPPEPRLGEQPEHEGFDPSAPEPGGTPPGGGDAGAQPHAPRQRHDAFTDARKRAFLDALIKTGCITEAAHRIGVSPRTIYRHQESDPRFSDHCHTALRMSATPIELTAWQRAVEGVEQEFACGGQVHVRRRYDGSLLRLLLQGSNPKKYGPRPGFKRKRLLKWERHQMRREIRAELAAAEPDIEEVRQEVLRKVQAIQSQDERDRLASGWTRTPDGEWVPPGYVPDAAIMAGEQGEGAFAPAVPGQEPPGDSMCQS
jgi:hypothetical protein